MEMHWSLIVFTLFMCWAAGTYFCQSLALFLGHGKKSQLLNMLVTLVLLVVGGIGVFTHLQHWERIFNGFGHITSGITWELILVIVFGVVIVLDFLFMMRSEDHVAPKWCAVLGMIAPIALVCVMSDSYFMPARPAWDTPLLMIYYLANALLLGGFAQILITQATGEREGYLLTLRLTLVGGIATLVTLIVYAIYLAMSAGMYSEVGYYFDPTLPDVPVVDVPALESSPLAGSLAPLYWILVIVVGCVLPSLLIWFERKDGKMLAASAASTPEEEAFDKAEAEKVADEDSKTGVREFFHIRSSFLSGKAVGVVSAGLVAVVVGSVGWRCMLYITAASVFAIFSQVL